MEIKLGQKVKDKVTGFMGIAVAKCIYLNGCVQFQIVPRFNPTSGVLYRNLWVDEAQLQIVDEGILTVTKPKSKQEPKKETFVRAGGIRSHPND